MRKVIFMIHGSWGGPWCWDNYKRFFEASGFRCVATTLRFHDMDPHGDPDPRLGTTSLLDYVDDLEREIRSLDAQPIVMGFSMGGVLAQTLASRGLAKALVLLNPAAPAGIVTLRPSVIRSFWKSMIWGFWKKPMRQDFATAVYSMLHLMPMVERRRIYDRFVFESGRVLSEIGYWFLDSGKAAQVDAGKVACPVLVIGSGMDRISPIAVVRQIAKKYRNVATYEEFADHAHWILAEPGWEDITGLISDWLLQVLSKPA